MSDIHQLHKQLSFLNDSLQEFRKLTKKTKEPRTKEENQDIVSQDIFLKIVSVVGKSFEEAEDFLTISQVAKMVWRSGVRPKINPEQFVECVIKAIGQFDLESEIDFEGIKYRRKK